MSTLLEPKTNLKNFSDFYPFQMDAYLYLNARAHALMLMPMGAGKTVVTLSSIGYKLKSGDRVLIFAPKRVAETVWPYEPAQWEHLKHLHIEFATGTPRKRAAVIEGSSQYVTLNYENMKWFCDRYPDPPFTAIIFDEITKMKSTRSQRWKAMRKMLPKFDIRIGLTGTPTSNSLLDLFGQAYCIDRGVALEKFITRYKKKWFEEVARSQGRDYEEWVPKPGAMEEILNAMQPFTHQMDPSVYKLTEYIDNPIQVALPAMAAQAYAKLRRDAVLELENAVITAESAASASMKLQQLVNGFLYTDDVGSYDWLHDAKLDAVGEVLDSQQGAPTLIAYKFIAELRELQKRFPGPSLSGTSNALAMISDWNDGKFSVMYIHPKSAGHGLNLQYGGSTLVWFGLPWSLEEYEQTVARIHRTGQTEPVINHIISVAGTVDDHIARALVAKGDLKKAAIAYFLR